MKKREAYCTYCNHKQYTDIKERSGTINNFCGSCKNYTLTLYKNTDKKFIPDIIEEDVK